MRWFNFSYMNCESSSSRVPLITFSLELFNENPFYMGRGLLLVVVSLQTQATVWRVNNVSGIDSDFNNLSTAISNASSGDTLYVEGSPNSYGSITVNKPLTLIGTGYFLTVNDTTQAISYSSTISYISFSSGASGSKIMGFELQGSEMYVGVNDIVIERNRIYSSGTYGIRVGNRVSEVLITKNFIHQYTNSTTYYSVFLEGNNNSILINNNIVLRGTSLGSNYPYSLYVPSNSSAVVQNNIFHADILLYNSTFQNNIQYIGGFSGSGNVVSNNIGQSTQFGTSNGNQSSVNMATVFAATGNFYLGDAFWTILPAGPAAGAGTGNVDCGAYGGKRPYLASGLPAIPSIFRANVPSSGLTSQPFIFDFSSKSNI